MPSSSSSRSASRRLGTVWAFVVRAFRPRDEASFRDVTAGWPDGLPRP